MTMEWGVSEGLRQSIRWHVCSVEMLERDLVVLQSIVSNSYTYQHMLEKFRVSLFSKNSLHERYIVHGDTSWLILCVPKLFKILSNRQSFSDVDVAT